MTSITVLFGTESGNSEMAASDITDALATTNDIELLDMADFESALEPARFYLIVCSTHGDGELPGGAQPFFDHLEASAPDLTGVNYAVFGLGDSSYDTYSQGSEVLDTKLRELGATRVGVYGRHDADTGGLASEGAVEWARETVSRWEAGTLAVASDGADISDAPVVSEAVGQ